MGGCSCSRVTAPEQAAGFRGEGIDMAASPGESTSGRWKLSRSQRVVLVEGCRTPFQKSGTGFRNLTSFDLARLALHGLLSRTGISGERIQRVILGRVVASLSTSNVAREAALAVGLPRGIPAHTVTQACISANQAITSGADCIATGRVDAVIAGGTESLTDIPILFRRRFRLKLIESRRCRSWGDYWKLLQGLGWRDLLPEVPAIEEFSTGLSMGEDCERLAARYGATRQEQDAFALRSHQLAAGARRKGWLSQEIVPVRVPPRFEAVSSDNGIREDSSLDQLARLKPAFVKPYGDVTAGNSSFLTDGAAAVLLMSEEAALAAGLRPKAWIRDYVYTAQDPQDALLLGPSYAVPRLLKRTGLSLQEIDVLEFHEAFAGQMVANLKCLRSESFARRHLGLQEAVGEVPIERLNRGGGSLALGHPFGATGARLVTTAANRLIREEGRLALVAACAAGGMGSAILLERYRA